MLQNANVTAFKRKPTRGKITPPPPPPYKLNPLMENVPKRLDTV